MVYPHRKFDLPKSEIRISDIGKSAAILISENQVELPILVTRFSYIGKSISVIQNYFPISVIRISDIGKSADIQFRS